MPCTNVVLPTYVIFTTNLECIIAIKTELLEVHALLYVCLLTEIYTTF